MDMDNSLKEFEKILLEYEKIPKLEKRQATLFDIMGNAHLENTCSNILSFFFDTRREHKLNDLFIKALLKGVEYEEKEKFEKTPISVIKIDREKEIVFTQERENKDSLQRKGRIDLLIETESHIICIENKIYHHSDFNPFKEYEEFVRKNYTHKIPVFVILNLLDKEDSIEKFQSVNYNSFIKNVELIIGGYLRKAEDKYLTFLIDFFYSIQKLKGNSIMNEEEVDFFIANYQAIIKINDGLEIFKNEVVKSKIEKLRIKPNPLAEEKDDFFNEIGVWQNRCFCFTFKLKNSEAHFGFDFGFFIEREYWEASLFVRQNQNNILDADKLELTKLYTFLRNNLKMHFDKYLLNNRQIEFGGYNRYILIQEEFSYSLTKLSDIINFILEKIKEFNDN